MKSTPTPAEIFCEKVKLAKISNSIHYAFVELHAFARLPIFDTLSSHIAQEIPSAQNLGSEEGISAIQISGKRLNRRDQDVFLELFSRAIINARAADQHVALELGIRELLVSLQRTEGGKVRELLLNSILSLDSAIFQFVTEEHGEITTQLVKLLDVDGKSLKIELPAEIAYLLTENNYTLINKSERLGLKSQVAKAIHAYFSSHRSGRWKNESQFRSLTGRLADRPARWKKCLSEAISEINQIKGWQCHLEQVGTASSRIVCTSKPSNDFSKNGKILRKLEGFIAKSPLLSAIENPDSQIIIAARMLSLEETLPLLTAEQRQSVADIDNGLDQYKDKKRDQAAFFLGKNLSKTKLTK